MRNSDGIAMKAHLRFGMEAGIWVVEKALRQRGDVSEYPGKPTEK